MVTIAKAAAPKELTRLEDMETDFVSLVPAGANRQVKMLVVKAVTCAACGAVVKPADDGTCPKCGQPAEAAPVQLDDTTKAAATPESASDSGGTDAPAGDFLATLASASALCDRRLDAMALEAEVTLPPPPAPLSLPTVAKCAPMEVPDAQIAPAPESPPAEVALRKALVTLDAELAQLRDELRKARAAEQSAVAKSHAARIQIGAASALRGAETIAKSNQQARPLWVSDLAAVAAGDDKPGN